MANQPPPYSEAVKTQGEATYGSVPGGAYPPQGPSPQVYPGGQGYPQPGQGYPPTGQGYPGGPPQPGYGGYNYDPSKYPNPGGAPSYQQQITVQPQTHVVVVGACPACRVGMLEDDYTCLGVFCAIMFFPIGLLCCLAMRQRRCTSCGAVFG